MRRRAIGIEVLVRLSVFDDRGWKAAPTIKTAGLQTNFFGR
jgi:hypothetical protein